MPALDVSRPSTPAVAGEHAPRATAAWRPGDPAGQRQFLSIGDLPLEADPLGELPDVVLAYETWGELNAAGDNAVYIAHAFSGDSHASGQAVPGQAAAGWWSSLVGPGKAIDPAEHFIVCANVVGGCQGSTGPAHPHPVDGRPWGSRFPWLTLRDMVAAEVRLADALGIEAWKLVIGPSLGGMRAVEWAATHPDRVRAIGVVGACAATTADQVAWATVQRHAIELDPGFAGGDYYDAAPGEGPHRGLALAREIAHTTYRSAGEFNTRFGRDLRSGEPTRPDGLFEVQSYLAHHGDTLVARFDANSYLRMIHAVLTHDVGRGRGGIDSALGVYTGAAHVIAVDSDRLYLVSDAQRLSEALPQAGDATVLRTPIGHDSFLIDSPELSHAVAGVLASA